MFEKLPRHPHQTFNVISLGDWLEICERVWSSTERHEGVPHVPAELVTFIPKALIKRFDHPGIERHLASFFEEINEAKERDYMLRWDCCASIELKHRLANGLCMWDEANAELSPDDYRLMNILWQYEDDMVEVWKRPWVDVENYYGHPVEYRVFVEGGEIAGISNYYPQRSLHGRGDKTDRELETVRELTQRLIEAFPCEVKPKAYGDPAKSFTADFVVTDDGEVLFLEGGPPHKALGGAHPCCFVPGNIEGVALWDQNEERI